MIDHLREFLDGEHSAVEVVRALIFDLARDSADAMMPIQRLAARRCPEVQGRCPSPEEMRRVVVAQLLMRMSGGREILWQGMGDYEDPVAPADLQQVAVDYGRVVHWAKREAPEVNWSIGPGYEERIWTLLGRVSDVGFLEEFFLAPEAFDVFDAETLALMFTVALPLFEALLRGRWDWCHELLERRADIRRMAAYEFPGVLVQTLSLSENRRGPADPEWVAELEVGLRRLPSWDRAAFKQRFGDDLRSLGIEL